MFASEYGWTLSEIRGTLFIELWNLKEQIDKRQAVEFSRLIRAVSYPYMDEKEQALIRNEINSNFRDNRFLSAEEAYPEIEDRIKEEQRKTRGNNRNIH